MAETDQSRGKIPSEVYSHYYASATRVDIVGIALIHFLRDDLRIGPAAATPGLNGFLGGPVFRALKEREELTVNACFLNPYAPFVKTRMKEERNPRCRQDLFDGIEAIKYLDGQVKDHNVLPDRDTVSIKGSLYIKLFRRNPYFSLFRAQGDGIGTLIRAGILLPGRLGQDCPELEIKKTGPYRDLFPFMNGLADRLLDESEILFEWRRDNEPVFTPVPKPKRSAYDVFFSYNRMETEDVSRVVRALIKKGVLPWMDTRVLPGSAPGWREELEESIRSVRRAAICTGRHGIGPTQKQELDLLTNRAAHYGTQIIVLLLPGSVDPSDDNFTASYQRIDLRTDWENGIHDLAQWSDPDD